MNWADYVIIGVISISVVISLVRGFVREAFSVATWIIAIFTAMYFYHPLADLLIGFIDTPSARTIIAFTGLFLLVILFGGFSTRMLSNVVDNTGLGGVNRLLGMGFGFVRGILIVGLLILLAGHTAIPQDPWYKQATLISKFDPVVEFISYLIPEKYHQMSALISGAKLISAST